MNKTISLIIIGLGCLLLACTDDDIHSEVISNQNNTSNVSPGNSEVGNNTTVNNTETQEKLKQDWFDRFTVFIPGGEFKSHDGEMVIMPSYRIFKRHVSIAQMWQYVRSDDSIRHSIGEYAIEQFFYSQEEEMDPNTDIRPFVGIDYEGAVSFCEWIGAHLVTENEWEYAALYDGHTIREVDYAWGNTEPQQCIDAIFKKCDHEFDGSFHCNICTCDYTVDIPSQSEKLHYPCRDSSQYPASTSPAGIEGLTGGVADLVADIYKHDASMNHRICDINIIKGGSGVSDLEHIKIRSREYVQFCDWGEDHIWIDYYYQPREIGFRCAFDVE